MRRMIQLTDRNGNTLFIEPEALIAIEALYAQTQTQKDFCLNARVHLSTGASFDVREVTPDIAHAREQKEVPT